MLSTFYFLRHYGHLAAEAMKYKSWYLQFIKDSMYFTAFYLTIISNTSIVTGVFPQVWKHALVIQLLKKGGPNNVSNYRPVSILSIA